MVDRMAGEEAPIPIEAALRFLRAEHEGALTFDEHTRSVRFILDPRSGRIVMPVMAAFLFASQHVLHVPDESDDAMHLLLSPDPIDARRDPLADRWRAHHGEEPDVNFVSCAIDMARWRGCVFDGESLLAPNPFANDEPALLRTMSADRDLLRAVCKAAAGVDVPEPTAVGVDPMGVDVRARFGVVRLEFRAELQSPDELLDALHAAVQSEDR